MPPNTSRISDADLANLDELFSKRSSELSEKIVGRYERITSDAIASMTAQFLQATKDANKHADGILSDFSNKTNETMQDMAKSIEKASKKSLADWAAIVGVPLIVMGAGFALMQSNIDTALSTYKETQQASLEAYEKVQDGKISVMAARIDSFEERFVALQDASDRNFDILNSSISTLGNSILIAIGIQPQTGKSGDKDIELPVRNAPE